jgi:hypothetical protein
MKQRIFILSLLIIALLALIISFAYERQRDNVSADSVGLCDPCKKCGTAIPTAVLPTYAPSLSPTMLPSTPPMGSPSPNPNPTMQPPTSSPIILPAPSPSPLTSPFSFQSNHPLFSIEHAHAFIPGAAAIGIEVKNARTNRPIPGMTIKVIAKGICNGSDGNNPNYRELIATLTTDSKGRAETGVPLYSENPNKKGRYGNYRYGDFELRYIYKGKVIDVDGLRLTEDDARKIVKKSFPVK